MPPGARVPRVAVLLLACVPISFLRRWPLPVLAAAVALASLVLANGVVPISAAALLGAAMYLVASRLPRPISVPAACTAAVALGATLLYVALTRARPPLAADAIEGFLPLAAAWFVGDAVAARRRFQAGLAEQAERERAAKAEHAQLQIREQRVRIARELHDVVAHTLTVITVQAEVGRRLMGRRPEEAASALESIEAVGRTAQEELRVVLGLLRDECAPADMSPAPRLADLKVLADTVRERPPRSTSGPVTA